MFRSIVPALAVCASIAGFYAVQPSVVIPKPSLAQALPVEAHDSVSALKMPNGVSATRRASGPGAREHAGAMLNRLPVRFEKIDGRTSGDSTFIARGYGRQLLLSCDRAVLAPATDASAAVTMHIEGVGGCTPSGERELAGRTNYLIGDDASQWRTDVRSYERAHFSQVYPGVDLVYYGTGGHLEYDFVVSPGADPSRIALRFDGADRVEIDANGNLVLHTRGGELWQHAPNVYQDVEGERRRTEGRYVMRGNTSVGFVLGDYDRSESLTIDPVLVYSSYLGTSESDTGADVALDSSGNIYMLGQTNSTMFPTVNPYQPGNRSSSGHNDLFIVKLDPSGTQLLYSTYLGGNGDDWAGSLAVDATGNIFVSGLTHSSDFPSVGGSYVYGAPGSPGWFVAKLSAGGQSLDYVAAMALSDAIPRLTIDASGQAYVTGWVSTSGLPAPNAAQPSFSGSFDAYVLKLNASGSALMYATYIGGTSFDVPGDIAVDSAGLAYVVGTTRSSNFPTASPFQVFNQGDSDAFLTVIGASGSTFVSSSYLGGSGADYGNDVAVHSDGTVAVVGDTFSQDFPVAHSSQPTGTAFVTKLDSTRTQLVFSTYLGGGFEIDRPDVAAGVAFDGGGAVHVVGSTADCGFHSVRAYPVFASTGCGKQHPFAVSYSATGALRHAMRVGGESFDVTSGMTLGPDKAIYLIGRTQSTNLPTINPFQSVNAGPAYLDAFLMKFATALTVSGASPGTASVSGGTEVEISGLNFMEGATVQFGDGPVVASTFVNPTLIRAIAPAHAAGTVSITVNNPDGESVTLPNGLQYSTCVFSLSFYDVSYRAGGGVGAVDLRNGEDSCAWTATSSVPWLRVTSVASGTGNAHLTFAIARQSTPGSERTGTLTIGGRVLTVRQNTLTIGSAGDFTGEGHASLATFRPADGRWTLAGQPDVTFGAIGDLAVPADYNNDGLVDRAVYRRATGTWFIQGLGTIVYGLPGDIPVPGDYFGDAADDIAVFRPSTGRWFIRDREPVDWGHAGDLPVPADYDGDNFTDIAVFRPSTGEWWIAGRAGAVTWGAPGDIPVPADYNGDGRIDIAVFRPSTGMWYVRDQLARSYGLPGDVPIPLDYDGDGRADIAVYRPSTGLWFIDGRGAGVSIGTPGDVPAFFRFDAELRTAPDLDRDRLADVALSDGNTWKLVGSAGGRSIASLSFGDISDVRRLADFDGDGRADLVLYRPGTGMWYVALSSTGYTTYTTAGPWGGQSGDVPMPADYDGDGRTDTAVFRTWTLSAEWHIRQSSDDTIVKRLWGYIGDVPMAQDVDGDGRADLIVWRRSVDGNTGAITSRWYIRRSSDSVGTMIDWGTVGDIAAPADYDGDGRMDVAVFRPSTGGWWILWSTSGYTTYTMMDYGLNGDVPVPADYDGDGRADLAVFRPSTGQFFAAPTGLLFTVGPGHIVVKR